MLVPCGSPCSWCCGDKPMRSGRALQRTGHCSSQAMGETGLDAVLDPSHRPHRARGTSHGRIRGGTALALLRPVPPPGGAQGKRCHHRIGTEASSVPPRVHRCARAMLPYNDCQSCGDTRSPARVARASDGAWGGQTVRTSGSLSLQPPASLARLRRRRAQPVPRVCDGGGGTA